MTLEQQDMNEWWNELDDKDAENSVSQSSMSFSHTLPSTQALRLANYSTTGSNYSHQNAITPTSLTPHNANNATSTKINNTSQFDHVQGNQSENETKESSVDDTHGHRQNISNPSDSSSSLFIIFLFLLVWFLAFG